MYIMSVHDYQFIIYYCMTFSSQSTPVRPPTEQMKNVVIDDGNIRKTSQRPQRKTCYMHNTIFLNFVKILS